MKRPLHTILFAVLLVLCCTTPLPAEETAGWYGLPFVTNYLPKQYNAHAINYDITTDGYGSVFVANFEGLLYYDGASWRKIYTPGISRITRVERDRKGRIWVGGYNVFGYLKADRKGQLALHTIVSDLGTHALGEVNGLKCENNRVYIRTNKGNTYYTDNGKTLKQYKGKQDFDAQQTVTFKAQALTVSVKHGDGLTFRHGNTAFPMTEKDGLCSNAVNAIHFDGNHTLWAVTNNGIFAIEVPSVYTQIGEGQGLRGEVYAVNKLHGTYYVGTLQGLYRIAETKAVLVDNIKSACWDIVSFGSDELLAATSEGAVCIKANEATRKINGYNTTAICPGPGKRIYTGEIDGIYCYTSEGTQRKRISSMGNLLSLEIKGASLFAETVNGQRWEIPLNTARKPILRRKKFDPEKHKLQIYDIYNRLWTTVGANSKELTLASDLPRDKVLRQWTKPLAHLSINDIYSDSKDAVMAGGPFGVIYCDASYRKNDAGADAKNAIPVYIRNVSIGDEVLWGGYSPNGMQPQKLVGGLQIPSDCNSLTITFSLQDRLAVTPVQYRYRINKDRWTDWDSTEEIRINNINWGNSTVDIEACDMFGRIAPVAQVKWSKAYPLYLSWYAIMLYLVLIAAGITAVGKWRLRKLTKAKEKLEQLVSERTSELSNALSNLKKAQTKLVHMERAATAGKLTQGLIDRILNPINYINNFAKLSSGLASDLAEDIDDEKDNMGEDNYEDCLDILKMMKQNLKKIEEHGVNTTRMLRAMEAMLNTTVRELHDTDLNAVCQEAVSISCEYQKDKLEANSISITAHLPQQTIVKPLDKETFRTTLISVITNAVYAVAKRKQRITSPTYKPEVTLTLATNEDGKAVITVHDNGIGIEEAIRNKIFDPFFTTKTTSEAAGVGLYLAREVVQAHHGTMELGPHIPGQTDFIITL